MSNPLLTTARKLTRSADKPRQSDLKRAVSTAYYAMFNFLARECADLLIGTGKSRGQPAWGHVHRALEHGHAKNACAQTANLGFPNGIIEFANMFVALQEQRHNADYDPSIRYSRAETIQLIDAAELAINEFKSAPRPDRRAFAVLVLLKKR